VTVHGIKTQKWFFEDFERMTEQEKRKRGGNRRATPDPAIVQTNFNLVNKPNTRVPITVSARGSGLCLYLSKDTCALYGIKAGHIIVAGLLEHYVKKREIEQDAAPDPGDLR